MSFLDTLKNATATQQVQFNVFLIEYKPGTRAIFALLEGRDDPSFYRRFLSSNLPRGYRLRLVNCGNRKGVLDAVTAFQSRYKDDERVIALIDKDHSDLVPNSGSTQYKYAFQTAGYSIENYVSVPEVVRRYCVEMLGLPDLEPACDQIQAHYEQALARFQSAAIHCMAWVVAARRRGDALHLNGLDTGAIFKVDDDLLGQMKISLADLYAYLEKVTGKNAPTPAVAGTAVDAVVDELRPLDPKTWLRGKQEIWFTVAFLNAASSAIKAKGVRAGSRVQLTLGNALAVLSGLCDPPPALESFLTTTLSGLEGK